MEEDCKSSILLKNTCLKGSWRKNESIWATQNGEKLKLDEPKG